MGAPPKAKRNNNKGTYNPAEVTAFGSFFVKKDKPEAPPTKKTRGRPKKKKPPAVQQAEAAAAAEAEQEAASHAWAPPLPTPRASWSTGTREVLLNRAINSFLNKNDLWKLEQAPTRRTS
jgi:hypothetical protein